MWELPIENVIVCDNLLRVYFFDTKVTDISIQCFVILLQNGAPSDPSSRHLEDRANWAKERLSLQLALNDAQQRIDHLTIERDQRSIVSSNGIEADHEKVSCMMEPFV